MQWWFDVILPTITRAHVTVGFLTVTGEDAPASSSHLHLNPLSTAIILEGGVVMENLSNLPAALCLSSVVSSALHLEYPRATRNTFNFIQRVSLRLRENKLPTRLHTLKHLLLIHCSYWRVVVELVSIVAIVKSLWHFFEIFLLIRFLLLLLCL